MKHKNVVLVDFKIPPQWDFLTVLEENTHETWYVDGKMTNRYHGNLILNMIRFLLYFIFPLKVLIKKNYNRIIGWQQFYGLNYAFWKRLFHLKKTNDLTVMTFIYKKKDGLCGMLYHKYMQYVVTSRYIDRFICFSKEECRYYSELFGVDRNKFVYIPLGEGDSKSEKPVSDEGYLFAVGRSNRNYDFIVDTLSETSYRLIIVSDTYKKNDIPKNITLLQNCYGSDMLNLMSKCHCVLIPLDDLKISSGQLVILQAMSLGKPVICTNTDGIKDYVINGTTGFLVNNIKESWLEIINKLYLDTKYYDYVSRNAFDTFNKMYTRKAMFERIAKEIQKK